LAVANANSHNVIRIAANQYIALWTMQLSDHRASREG
jgi:hypothetical protein